MTKRQKFILSSFLLSVALLGIQFVHLEFRYVAIFGFFLVTYLISSWALFEDLKGVEWLTILSLPSLYAAGISLFYFLLPEGFISRTLIIMLFGMGLYALYLTENIFSVAAIRTIQLIRAAHAVGFLLSILTLVLFYNTIFSLKWPFYINGLMVGGLSWPIMLQGLWSIKLEPYVSKELVGVSLALSLLLGQMAIVLSFMPVTVWIASLFLATVAYVSLGLFQHAINDRLFVKTIYEYVGVGIFVLIATLFVTPW